jgi:BASS family bile acid:Na+ symporter
MSRVRKICDFLSSNIAILIIIFSVIAFFYPKGFSWATNYTTMFLGAAMFGMGLTIKAEDFRIVFTRPKDLCIGFILQYTVMPLAAFALAKAFGLSADLALGVILVGCCPGGTASNVITYVAKGDVPLSVGMTIVSTLLAPLCTPVLVYFLAGSWVEVSLVTMMISVVKVVLIPVLAGILIYQIFPKQVDAVREMLPLVSVIAIVMIISGIVGSNAEKIMTCGLLVMVVVAIHNTIGLALGTVAAKLMKLEEKKVTAIGIEVGMQNSGLAISLATANFAANPLATLPGAIFSVWHNISGTIYAGIRNRRVDEEQKKTKIRAAAENS